MYKIIRNNQVVDVVQIPRFVRFLSSGHMALTDKISAQGIVGSDNKTVYSFAPVVNKSVLVATIEEITLEELNRLTDILSSEQEVTSTDDNLTAIKDNIIKCLSSQCKNKIISGFTLELSDGDSYNFRLTTEDQLNLISIENQLNSGTKTFVYHATNKPCRVFYKDDMKKIINAFRKHVTYHTTYFNAAKQYINSLNDIEKINLFTYGTDLTDTVDDIILKQILNDGGVC